MCYSDYQGASYQDRVPALRLQSLFWTDAKDMRRDMYGRQGSRKVRAGGKLFRNFQRCKAYAMSCQLGCNFPLAAFRTERDQSAMCMLPIALLQWLHSSAPVACTASSEMRIDVGHFIRQASSADQD